ncbi:PREDICTED: ester hydrolase C11orf54 homolog [Diuraphis noxia]|uniref:ester hydrolase C11orf54 homolog n=1 Tax=Diuraphis noxia TaxID=143948 RepID=UPI0007638C6A|nr:PREDICTED: ester hydrolase C11orf54 homolog [Diuraphis noxia]
MLISAILPELLENFENVSAEVVQCPDLTQPPFNLTSEGLCGDENVFDIGDVTNFVPSFKREKLYNVKDLKQITGSDPLTIIGACGGPFPFFGADSEAKLSPPSVGVGCIVSHDPGLNLRLQHFHLYTDRNEGGHYHNDTEPNTIKYTGYFGVSKQFIKID